MNRHPSRILLLSSSWPHGQTFGGQLRALNIGRALKQMGNVTLLVVGSDAGNSEAMRKSAEEFEIELPVCPQLSPNSGTLKKLKWACDPWYLNAHGYIATVEDRTRIISYFDHYDLVWLLNSRTPNILHVRHWPHSHLDVDDVPSAYLRTVSQSESSWRKRWEARAKSIIFKRRELLFKERFTTLSVCSEEDRNYLGGGDQIHVIPNGFERPRSVPVPRPSTNPPRIGFIGLCSYAPNLEGLRWFLKESWPAIRNAVAGIRFRLAGKGADGHLNLTDPDVDVLGWIDDPAAEIATWSAMVIPIRFGGGTRIKIADAFSRKCPVVSTSFGAFGYRVEDGKQLRLADTPNAFAAACVDLICNQVQAASLAERAWQQFLETWTWDAIYPKVCAAAEACLRRSADRSH